MTLHELIDKLPEADQAKVREYLKSVAGMPVEAAMRFVKFYQDGDYRAARKELIAHMSAAELDQSMDETNARMKAAGQRVSNEKARTKAFVDYIFQGLANLVMTALLARIEKI